MQLPSAITGVAWVIGLMTGLGTVGRFVDFYIGKPGREKVKDWLLRGWTRFDDMKWSNFSEKEAQYFVNLQDRVFGPRLLSWRRFLACVLIHCIFLATSAIALHRLFPFIPARNRALAAAAEVLQLEISWSSAALIIAFSICSLAVSISFSRFLSTTLIRISSLQPFGVSLYVALLLVHYALFAVWQPLVQSGMNFLILLGNGEVLGEGEHWGVRSSSTSWGGMLEMVRAFHHFRFTPRELLEQVTDVFNPVPVRESPTHSMAHLFMLTSTVRAAAYFANALRILVGLVLVASFVLREWISRAFSTLWARIYEDDKGAFTLIFGGIGAVAGGLKWLLGAA